MRLWLMLFPLFFAMAAPAAVVRVTAGEHPGFTRLVLQYEAPVNWTLGRTADGYALQLAGQAPQYDLSKVFDQIGKTRLAAIWADPETGALHVGVGCACHAMPFEFRPGTIVIDLKDGAPPQGSSFELPVDGGVAGDLGPPPVIRPKPRPDAPRPVYDWTSLAFVVPQAPFPAGIDPKLEPLRQVLIEQLSRGASEGIVDMARPKAEAKAPAETGEPVAIRLGDAPNLVVRQQGEAEVPLTAAGSDCIADDRLDLASWASGAPVGGQIGPALSGLTGEFDRPDPQAVRRAIRFDLALGFGAEARALMRAFPTGDGDAAIWQSLARILDGEPDPQPAFAAMAACDGNAALWAMLAASSPQPLDPVAKAAILRSFSALPAHLRRHLGPRLVDRFQVLEDRSTVTALREAILRSPGDPGPEIALMEAKIAAAMGETDAADSQLAALSAQPGPVTADALVALVEQRAALGQPVSLAEVQTLQEFLKERQGGAEEPRFRHALVLALAASSDFDGAFAMLDQAPNAAPLLWQNLARTGPDSALLIHATLAEKAVAPMEAQPVAEMIADRMLTLGLPDQALGWLRLQDQPPPLLVARVALARSDAQTALTMLKPGDRAALPLRAEALQRLGAEQAAAEIYTSLGQPDLQWAALARAHAWDRLAKDGPPAWQAAAAMLLAPTPPGAEATPPVGPLARDAALLIQSAATRDAIVTLLDTVKSPSIPTQ